ncbi:hypothetical protein ACM66B_004259 [Microbotryomycetes sp. NB124-2]
MTSFLPSAFHSPWRIGTSITVSSSTGNAQYNCTRTGDDTYSCDCNSWKYQTAVKGKLGKTCKHLRQLLGDEHEVARTGFDPAAAKVVTRRGVSAHTIMASSLDAGGSVGRAGQSTRGSGQAITGDSQGPPAPKRKRSTRSKANFEGNAISETEGSSVPAPRPALEPGSISLLMAHKYDPAKLDPTGYWVSEKLDGVRAYWDGHGTLWTRIGRPFAAPKAFLDHFPQGVSLDGELFIDRGRFDETSGIVRTTVPGATNDARWERIKYMVFDIPSDGHLPFEQRQDKLRQLVSQDRTGPLQVVKQVQCESVEHLTELVSRVAAQGGEGVMLRQPGSIYVNKRDKSLLKVKSFYDAEARVVDYEPGKGKYVGLVGSLICQMQSGHLFSVGSGLTDQRRLEPPEIGSIVTYKFQELTKTGVPRFPVFVGERIDAVEPKDAVIGGKKAED